MATKVQLSGVEQIINTTLLINKLKMTVFDDAEFRLVFSSHGFTSQASAEVWNPDILIMRVQMRQISGILVTERLRVAGYGGTILLIGQGERTAEYAKMLGATFIDELCELEHAVIKFCESWGPKR